MFQWDSLLFIISEIGHIFMLIFHLALTYSELIFNILTHVYVGLLSYFLFSYEKDSFHILEMLFLSSI